MVESFHLFPSVNKHISIQKSPWKLSSSVDNTGNSGNEFSNKSDVEDVINTITQSLSKVAPSKYSKSSTFSDDTGLLELDLKQMFNKILSDIRETSSLSNIDKAFVISETASILKDALDNNLSTRSEGKLQTTLSKTSVYSDNAAPIVLVYGPGPIGTKMKEIADVLGKTASIKFINGEYLNAVKDSEISYNVREAKTVIIACDDKAANLGDSKSSGGWFSFGGTSSSSDASEFKYCIDSKGLKKLLNAVLNDQKKRIGDYSSKIIWLGSAVKQSRGFASILGGNSAGVVDAEEINNDFILQCKQRGFRYLSVLIGTVLPDGANFPNNYKRRDSYSSIAIPSGSTVDVGQFEYPVFLSPNKLVESSEYTRVSAAAEALYRASTHPNGNSTLTVLSTPFTTGIDEYKLKPSDDQWDDEFLKIDGPELLRIPLLFASAKQAVARLNRAISKLASPGSGLVTPIELSKYSNGLRIVFVPNISTYESSKDEKDKLKIDEKLSQSEVKKPKYIPPEKDKNPFDTDEDSLKTIKSKSKPKMLEGGIEVYIDDVPVPRIRIRRCNMGPETIVKEESENIIVKSIVNSIKVLENDIKILKQDSAV